MTAPRCEFCGADAAWTTGGGAAAEILACADCRRTCDDSDATCGAEAAIWDAVPAGGVQTGGERWERCSYCDRAAAAGVVVVRPEGRWPACDGCASRVLSEFRPEPAEHVWREYDILARFVAQSGGSGNVGTSLPDGAGAEACALIDADPDAFAARVADMKYAESMGERVTFAPCDPTADLDTF